MPCKTDACWYYYTLELGSVHDVSTGVVEMRKRDAGGNRSTGHTLSTCEVCWVVLAEHLVMANGAATLMLLEGDDRVDSVPPPQTI